MTDLRGVDPRRLLRLTEAAQRLGITAQTLRVWVKNGSVPAVRPGRSLFVPIAAIEALERGDAAQPHSASAPALPEAIP
jgi:excisionase family DNA binding protein